MAATAEGALYSYRSTSPLIIAGAVTDLTYQVFLIYTRDQKAYTYCEQAFYAMPKTFAYAVGGALGAALLGTAIGYSLEKAGMEQKTRTISSIAGSILGIYLSQHLFQSDIVRGVPAIFGTIQIGNALFGPYRQDMLANMP